MKRMDSYFRMLCLVGLIATLLMACKEEESDFLGKVPYLEQRQSTYEIDDQEQDVQVTFTTNIDEVFFDQIMNEYLIIGETQPRPCDWITQANTRVKVSDHTYTFHVTANESTLPRKAFVAAWFVEPFSDRGILAFVHFVQAGKNIYEN